MPLNSTALLNAMILQAFMVQRFAARLFWLLEPFDCALAQRASSIVRSACANKI